MTVANLQIRVDEDLRAQAQQVAGALGMDLTTAVRVFLKQMVAEKALPFRPVIDPFYSTSNMEALKISIAQLESGRVISKTLDELNALAQ